jgi:gamma-glutamyltranspeptidase / glutathione hydrolase
MNYVSFAAALLLSLTAPALAQQQFTSIPGQGRSMVVSKLGIVAAPQFLASQAGVHVLEQGGNAIDAAIAANSVMGVVQPYVNGIGGDLFVLYYEAKTGKAYGLNASGWTPKALTLDWMKQHRFDKIDFIGVNSITVPGAVAGWDEMLRRFGKLTLKKDLASAIYYADNGFPLAERNARWWSSRRMMSQPGWKDTYLPTGTPPKVGDLFVNKGLANSLRQIADHGRDAFYNGPMTDQMVKFLDAQGGAHARADFSEYRPEWVEPVSTTYHGWTVYELPPNGQGVAALSMLNIMENFPLAQYGQNSVDALHVMIEAKKLAYADMAKYVGDPRFGPIPVAQMISKDLAKERAKLIDMKKATCQVVPSDIEQNLENRGHSTIYLSTIDKDGNIVSLIQSNYAGYGTGMVAPGLGFSFHNRGADFDLKPGLPNTLEGRKRPLHTIIPAFMEKGDMHIGFGIMGGWNQAQAHAQYVSDIVDFGMNIQAAFEKPRFTKTSFDGCDVEIEETMPGPVRDALSRRGHQIKLLEPFDFFVGQADAVAHDSTRNVNFGAADPRADGSAIPEQPALK